MLMEAGSELSPDDLIVVTEAPAKPADDERQVVPQSVKQFQMSNPFLAPDFSASQAKATTEGRLNNWELIEPLFRSFETGAGGGAATMNLPAPRTRETPGGLDLMIHQARFVESARAGHRSYLLADEPGLGKTAQALLAANVTGAYPLLVVVPNVVKVNWAREVQKWTPQRTATVVHGDGDDIDAFADVTIVNYEVLDRHVAWLSRRGFKGMVVDEAHFIKNKDSQRSKNVLAISRSIRAAKPDALFVALTGTPLINQIEDFRMIWQFLGWIDDKKPLPRLMRKLEETELSPGDPGFFAAARSAVIDMGIVRRKKVDVAADIPARRIADIPVELDGESGRSIHARGGRAGRPPRGALPPALDRAPRQRAAPTSSGWSPPPSSRSRRVPRPATTCSRWCARSGRRRPRPPPTSRSTWRATSARWCSSPSTST